MANRRGKSGSGNRLYFWRLQNKIIAYSDCSLEIKKHLLLGRKAMTNLDSIFKSRDITLPTKVHIVKAIFPAVMYRCESWIIKNAECQRTDAFKLWCWKRLWEPLDSKEIKPVNPKRNQNSVFTGRTVAEAEAPILLPSNAMSWLIGKDPDAGKDWKQKEEGQQWMRWLHSVADSVGLNLSKLREVVEDREAWCAAVHGVAKSQTGLSDWTTAASFLFHLFLLVGGKLRYNIIVVFAIHWHESAMDLYVFPILNPPPTSLP